MYIKIEPEQMEEFKKAFEESKVKKEFLEECRQSAIRTGRIKKKK